ncbi:hypothetical protein L6452_06230 [Arctium lappa]|uniref:Uncharacterized protein n=1 Tax=Arctium lappa TaxID=4217 RepID=A0ACB9EIY6_ARCLA|nr:hypothetical protein L6452_06230 [Arctium lappa]
MVNTRGRPRTRVDGLEATASTADQPEGVEVVMRPPVQQILGGGPEVITRVDLASSHPVIRDASFPSELMASMMLAIREEMAKQQEFLLKVIEDRAVNNRRSETVVENIIAGSGGAITGVRAEENRIVGAPRNKNSCSYKSFLGCRPPEFFCFDDPVVCVKWIRAIEQAFGSSECGDDQRVQFGTQLLRDTALIWWNVIQSTLTPVVLAQLSWTEFKKKLLEEFCNERTMDRIEKEFRSLEKGSLTVREYTRQFMEKLVDMQSMVHNSKASNLREMVEEAQYMEEMFAKRNSEKAVCGKNDHTTRDCSVVGMVCFECKAPGHVKRDCPKLKSGSVTARKENPPRDPGRAFQMTAKEARASADVVSGTFLINFVPARILFDTGASFFFVSELFRQKIPMPTTSLEDALVVEIVDGSQVLIHEVLKQCTLSIERR